MSDQDRAELRAIQDAWLALPAAQRHVSRWGWDVSIAHVGTPTFAQVRDTLLPNWRGWFREFIEGAK